MNKKFIPLAVLLVIVMCVISEYIGEKELMFPEVSALVISAWLTKKSTSQSKSLHFWLSPTLAAVTGILILKLFPYSPLFMIAGAFILVAMQLTFMNSEIYPALSAAILPILLHTESWYYPLSVCIFTGIIACGKKIIYISSKKENKIIKKSSGEILKFNSSNLIQWGALLICVLLVSAFALYFHWNYIVAPPLIVTFVELAKRNGKTKYNIGLIFISLVFASFLGTLCLYLICHVLHLPVWISAGLSVTCVLIAFYFLDFSWPPTAAIATLPVLVPSENLWMYPCEVLAGCFIFLIINMFWMKKTSLFKSTFSENLDKSIAK